MSKKIALITGASSGIGRETAKFLSQNHRLILCGRRKEKLLELQEELADYTESIILTYDVRNREEVISAIDGLEDSWKEIDVLINNAGNAHGLDKLEHGDTDDWDAMMDGNVKGLLYVSKAVIPLMTKRNTGHIVNISSIAGKQTYVNGVVYCASKKAVEAISEGMRLELTERGIKVTNIAPGAVHTDFSNVRFKGNEEKAERVYQNYTPLYAEDIANTIAFAVNAPEHVTIADLTILPKAQAAASIIHKNTN